MYCHNNPINFIDPLGLENRIIIDGGPAHVPREWQHDIPQQQKENAAKAGVDVDAKENGRMMDKPEHRLLHRNRKDKTGKTRNWNKDWEKWRKDFKNKNGYDPKKTDWIKQRDKLRNDPFYKELRQDGNAKEPQEENYQEYKKRKAKENRENRKNNDKDNKPQSGTRTPGGNKTNTSNASKTNKNLNPVTLTIANGTANPASAPPIQTPTPSGQAISGRGSMLGRVRGVGKWIFSDRNSVLYPGSLRPAFSGAGGAGGGVPKKLVP